MPRELNDNSEMPFGVHKGKKMANVPASYLLWLYREKSPPSEIRRYIEENIDALEQEIKEGGV